MEHVFALLDPPETPLAANGARAQRRNAKFARHGKRKRLADPQLEVVVAPVVPEQVPVHHGLRAMSRLEVNLSPEYADMPEQELMDALTAIVFGDFESANRQVDGSHDWMLGSANDFWASARDGVLVVDSRLPSPEKHALMRAYLEDA